MKKKILKIIGIIFGVIIVFALGLFINHRIRLSNEKDLLTPLGQIVEVDGAKMSVYTEGDGDKTIVFLSGGGTCSPILDFRSLYSLLSSDYKIAVVEKFGYGFSDVTDKSRDIDTILENTREALSKAGVSAPYVLCPHSMSGIESLYWVQKYPDEVSAIIGLDMAVPEAYEKMNINPSLLKMLSFSAKMGVTRLGNFSESDAIKYGTLTDREKDIYRAVFFTRTMTSDMIHENTIIKENAAKVADMGIPDISLLMFCSDGNGTGFTAEEWRNIQSGFAEKHNAEIIFLDCGHYVHDREYVKISEDIKAYLQTTERE